MRLRIGLLNVGDKVNLNVHRGNKKLRLQATITGDAAAGKTPGENLDPRLAGAVFSEIPVESPFHDKVKGIYVQAIERGSTAIASGLEPGDIIVTINQQSIPNLKAARTLFRNQPKQLLMNIQRGPTAFFLLIR